MWREHVAVVGLVVGPPVGRGVCGSARALIVRPRDLKIVVYVYRTIWHRSKESIDSKKRTWLTDEDIIDDKKR